MNLRNDLVDLVRRVKRIPRYVPANSLPTPWHRIILERNKHSQTREASRFKTKPSGSSVFSFYQVTSLQIVDVILRCGCIRLLKISQVCTKITVVVACRTARVIIRRPNAAVGQRGKDLLETRRPPPRDIKSGGRCSGKKEEGLPGWHRLLRA